MPVKPVCDLTPVCRLLQTGESSRLSVTQEQKVVEVRVVVSRHIHAARLDRISPKMAKDVPSTRARRARDEMRKKAKYGV